MNASGPAPARCSVLAVGYLSLDAVETAGERAAGLPGGAALYIALGARAAGARAAICACAGEDYPEAWLARLAALGVRVDGVERRAGPTRRAGLAHAADGGRRSTRDEAWWERTRALRPPLERLEAAWPLREGGVVAAAPMPVDSLERLVAAGRRRGLRLVADTSEAFVEAEPHRFMAALASLWVFAPSREETRLLRPGLSDDDAARALARLGPAVLQKRGADGAFLVEAGGGAECHLPAPLLPPPGLRDPTGAGDATLGALAAALSEGRDFEAAARSALEIGARTVTGLGPSALGFAVDAESGAQNGAGASSVASRSVHFEESAA